MTRKALFTDAEVAPGVTVAVGLGAPLDPDSRALAEVVTDAQGRAAIAIPRAELYAGRVDRGARLWLRVTSPGYQRRTQRLLLERVRADREIAVIVIPGGNLIGRLLDDHDRPVSGTVHAKRWGARDALAHVDSGSAGADGWFEIGLREEGTYQLLADASEPPMFAAAPAPDAAAAGTGALRDVELRFTDPPQRVVMHLSGAGVLRARVRDSAGRPCAGLAVLALQSELDDERGSFALPEPRASELALEGCGRLWATAVTAADGSFEVSGLRRDRYVVRARTSEGSSGGYPYLLTAAPVAAVAGSALELVFDHPHLAVSLLAADGSPWTGEAKIAFLDPDSWADRGWPKEPTLAVAPAFAESLSDTGAALLGGHRVDGGEYVFEVAAGRTYLVGLLGGGRPWAPATVFVPAGSSRVDVPIAVADDAPAGTLVLTASGAVPSGAAGGVRITIEDRTTRAALAGLRCESLGTTRLELPEGRYRAIVEGAALIEFWHGSVVQPRGLGTAAVEFDVAAGRESSVEVVLPAGARVRLRLDGAVADADRKKIHESYAGDESELDYWAGRAKILLLSPDQRPEPVDFPYDVTGGSGAGRHIDSRLSLGDVRTSEIVRSGTYTLEARLPGGRVATVPVVLTDGATTEVELTFP